MGAPVHDYGAYRFFCQGRQGKRKKKEVKMAFRRERGGTNPSLSSFLFLISVRVGTKNSNTQISGEKFT
jgi:hypothetical protein